VNKAFSLFFLLLIFSLFITSWIHLFNAQPNDCPPYWVPVYLSLNESKPISIYIWDGMSLEYTATTNQSVTVNFRPNILVILESQYPFAVDGKLAWYNNGTTTPFYFYEFRANESTTLNINFMPKPLPNTPVGYINLDSPTPILANSSFSDMPTKPVYVINAENLSENYNISNINSNTDSSGTQFFIFLGILGIIISIFIILLISNKK